MNTKEKNIILFGQDGKTHFPLEWSGGRRNLYAMLYSIWFMTLYSFYMLPAFQHEVMMFDYSYSTSSESLFLKVGTRSVYSIGEKVLQWPFNFELSTRHLNFTTSLHYDFWHLTNTTCSVEVAQTLLHLTGEYNLV